MLKTISVIAIITYIYSISTAYGEYRIYKKISLENIQNPKATQEYALIETNTSKFGTISIGVYGTFDSLNWFASKGIKARGLDLTHETLMHKADNEELAYYPLIAEYIEDFDNKTIVHINPNAKWHDNSPITADDIVFSFYELINKASPFFRFYLQYVEKAEKINDLTAQFVFKKNMPHSPLTIAEMPILSKKFNTKVNINKTHTIIPMGSGPYIIEKFEVGQEIVYQRNKNYWGANLPINKHRFNFDKIIFKYYRDESVMMQAFKTNDFDVLIEKSVRKQNLLFNSIGKTNKNIKYETTEHRLPSGMVGLFINTRKEYLKDIKVRKALNYAFDFKWFNKNFFNNYYKRIDSYFANSHSYATSGLPNKEELKILTQNTNNLPQEILTQKFIPQNTLKNESIEENLQIALKLLNEAGWNIIDSKLIDKNGNQMKLEITDYQRQNEKFLQNFANNLKKLGIKAEIKILNQDQYKNELCSLNYDLIAAHLYILLFPVNQVGAYWHSKTVNIQGSKNFSGINNKIIDSLVTEILSTDYKNTKILIEKMHVLDRILLWNYYVVPFWYSNKIHILYWDKFYKPKTSPKYTDKLFYLWWHK